MQCLCILLIKYIYGLTVVTLKIPTNTLQPGWTNRKEEGYIRMSIVYSITQNKYTKKIYACSKSVIQCLVTLFAQCSNQTTRKFISGIGNGRPPQQNQITQLSMNQFRSTFSLLQYFPPTFCEGQEDYGQPNRCQLENIHTADYILQPH